MKMLKTGLLSVALALAVAPAFAESNPRAGSHDSRVRIATYADGQVYRLRVSLTHVTSVEFGEGETIRSILAGDTEGFQLDGVPGGRAFAVKPLARGVSTNITVYTNRRSYYFTVTESSSPTYYVVQFRYPQDRARPTNAVAQRAPNYNYAASGRSEITPTAVWDDGTFTYFRFAPNAPVPAIFQYSAGRERTVNSQQIEDGVLRVSGVNRQWVLRLGDTVICIQENSTGGTGS